MVRSSSSSIEVSFRILTYFFKANSNILLSIFDIVSLFLHLSIPAFNQSATGKRTASRIQIKPWGFRGKASEYHKRKLEFGIWIYLRNCVQNIPLGQFPEGDDRTRVICHGVGQFLNQMCPAILKRASSNSCIPNIFALRDERVCGSSHENEEWKIKCKRSHWI